ncbi:platelet-activating factor acetylhydrolase IB subunit alpha1-like [Clytia hemisphaerica]|uniref:SGNH hydrolase-type esterase domain-containing protein n=1 Tax=Clytia hemisphaerica TaxID=252671 RepID=A0A7M5XE52_9CNID|eukprot:TCONS_00050000-protein
MSASEPAPVEDVQGDGRWSSMHQRQVESCRLQKPNVLFVGDSLIQRLEDTETWEDTIKPLNAVNAGIGGDRTEHVLWRLQNGLLQHCKPKVVVILCGTNNHQHSSDEIVDALEAICWSVADVLKDTKIVLIALLPRGEKDNPLRNKIYQINYGIEQIISTIPNTHLINADPGFVRSDGVIFPEDMADYLHLTRRGYKKFCVPIMSCVKKFLQEDAKKEKAFNNSIYTFHE